MHIRALQLCLRPGGVAAHGIGRSDQCQPVVHAAGRLHQLRGGQVFQRHHGAGREVDEVVAPVRLARQHSADAQAAFAEQQVIADLQAERIQHGRLGPDLSMPGAVRNRLFLQRWRHAPWTSDWVWLGRTCRDGSSCAGRSFCPCGAFTCLAAGACGRCWLHHPQRPAQGISGTHRLEHDQPPGLALFRRGTRHGREGLRLDGGQAQRSGTLDKGGRSRLVAAHHHIATEHLRRIAQQGIVQPVGKETNRRQRCHRQQHGQHQHAQLTRAHIAPERAPAQAPEGNRRRGSCHRIRVSVIVKQLPQPTQEPGQSGRKQPLTARPRSAAMPRQFFRSGRPCLSGQ